MNEFKSPPAIAIEKQKAIVGLGCNTVHGFGKDTEKAGEKIQDGTN